MNYVKFTLKNLNKEKILKEIVKITSLKNVKITESEFSFYVNSKYQKKVNKILKSKNCKIVNKEKKGLFTFLRNTVLRLGVVIVLAIMFIFLCISNLFVFQYKVLGLDLLTENEIYNVLKENDITGIKLKSNINKKQLENLILNVDKVSLVSVVVKGNTLIINIKEKIYNEEYEDKGQFKPLVSNYNGIITEISVISGTPLVKMGQTVKVGQELVAPYTIDSSGNKLSVKPLAEIKADTFNYTISEFSDEKIIYEDTGKKIKSKQIFLGNSVLYKNSKENSFQYYRVEDKITYLTSNLLLPLKIFVAINKIAFFI